MAGLDATEVKKSAVVNWMITGVYQTREVLYKMNIIKSDLCTACNMNVTGSLAHYVLHCPYVEEIRNNFVPKFILSNPRVVTLGDDETALLISILDPESSLLPEDIRHNWESSTAVYAWSRDFVYNVHNKFKKFYET